MNLSDRLLTVMLSMSFAGGTLFGLLGASLRLPPVLWAPLILVATGGFALIVKRGSDRREAHRDD